jgi:excisionase family DNA binding protein
MHKDLLNKSNNMEITFDSLPKAISQLCADMAIIKQHLIEKVNEPTTEPDRWFDLNELCNYHPDKPSKATVYGWVNAGLIPVHKSGRKLRFLKTEIDSYLKQGRKKTLEETAKEAVQYLLTKKGLNYGK